MAEPRKVAFGKEPDHFRMKSRAVCGPSTALAGPDAFAVEITDGEAWICDPAMPLEAGCKAVAMSNGMAALIGTAYKNARGRWHIVPVGRRELIPLGEAELVRAAGRWVPL